MSRYAEAVAAIALDLHGQLVQELELFTPPSSIDPVVGERTGLLSAIRFGDGSSSSEKVVTCTFLASAGFAEYWESQEWAIATATRLDDLLHKLATKVDRRSILGRIERTGDIVCGNPRAPIRQVQGQASHIWVVDVMAPCRIVLLIRSSEVCGHL